MASLSALTSTACQGTQGLISLDSLSDAPGASGGTYSWTVVNQATGTDYGGPVEVGNSVSVPDGAYLVRVYATYDNGTTASSSPRTHAPSCAGNTGGGGGGGGGTTPPPPPSQVYGCTDEEADNYDPAATDDDGSCTYAPRLTLADLPELAPLGVPLWASLAAAPIAGAVPAPATVLLDLSALGAKAGVQVRVDGYLFTSGPLIVPGRFGDAASLLLAVQAWPGLAAAYTLSQPTASQVLLTAKVLGLPGTPTVSTTDAASVQLTRTPGVAELYSQKRYQWGCFVEVWAGCGAYFGGPVDKGTAQLAQRVALAYRADNAYQVDIAPALRGFTGHAYPQADGTCPDRLVSYFLRFGEEYADAATGLRRVRRTYESPVAWGLEAMTIPAPVSGVYLLSSRPQPWRVVAGRRAVAAMLSKGARFGSVLSYRLATSRDVLDAPLVAVTPARQVRGLVPTWDLPEGALSGALCYSTGLFTTALASFEVQAAGVGLTFANREGGCDTVFFSGNNEESDKRTAATYANSAGPVNLSAEVQPATKLYSGLLDFATWDWLRQQLGTSPAAWLETDAGPVRVLLAEVSTEADTQKGEYSLAVTLNPPPVRGLSN